MMTIASLYAVDTQALLTRVRGEFLEMPGLRLAPAQAARLWAVDRETCERLMLQLVDAGFLWRTRDGAFLRRADEVR